MGWWDDLVDAVVDTVVSVVEAIVDFIKELLDDIDDNFDDKPPSQPKQPCPGNDKPGVTPPKIGDLTVTVTDAKTGKLIEGAEVVVQQSGRASHKALTDKDGKVVFKDLAVGSYTIEGSKQDYDPKTGNTTVKEKPEKNEAELKLDPALLWPINIKGKLFWNRDWNYADSKKKLAPAKKEYLPGARVRLLTKTPTEAGLSEKASMHVSDDGEFEFKGVAELEKAALKIELEYRDSKVTKVIGRVNAASDADFEIKKDAVIWHQLNLDTAQMNGKVKEVDLGDVEIKHALFREIADMYKSIWFGHKRLKELVGKDMGLCPVIYPQDASKTSWHSGGKLFILADDRKDRSVLLHEYGHFVENGVVPGASHPGYGYNDDASGGHSRDSKEHYEAAWKEGFATFLSCALNDSPIYHDGYDTYLTYDLAKDNTAIGPHSEGSIQCAQWRIYKHHGIALKDGFWKAWTTTTHRTVRTIVDFYDNWKDLGMAGLDKVEESYKKHGMEYAYNYKAGADMHEAAEPPPEVKIADKKFRKVDDLHAAYGTVGGGTKGDYNEEFYNRNKQFNKNQLDAGSTPAAPKVKKGNKYITPERRQLKK